MLNDIDLIRKAALDNHGIAYVIEDHVAADIAEGALVRVLEDWTPPFDGYYLYYPSRRQPSPVFSMLLAALRFRE